MTPYTYSGPLSGVTLAGGQEVVLIPGATVFLPADNDYTRTLIARMHLAPASASLPPAQKPAKAPKPAGAPAVRTAAASPKAAPPTPTTGS